MEVRAVIRNFQINAKAYNITITEDDSLILFDSLQYGIR